MRGPRRLLAPGLALVTAACTSHERPQAPSTACPEGMMRIAGARPGARERVDLCVDRTEVTTAAYAACVDAGGCTPAVASASDRCNLTDGGRGDDPINCVTFEQATAYCARLGKRLPDVDEWRLAVAGGDPARRFPWGDAVDPARACVGRPPAAGTCPVGGFPAGASAAGIVDLVGDVAEWVTAAGDPSRPFGAVGGAWSDPAIAAVGDDVPKDERPPATLGLRCAVAPFTPVQAIEERPFTPYRSPRRELPRLAEPLAAPAPTLPLAHLQVLGQSEDDRGPSTWWPTLDGFERVDAATFTRVGAPPSSAIDAASIPAALAELRPRRPLGELALWTGGWATSLRFAVIERGSAQVRWQRLFSDQGASYVQAIGPRTLVAAFTNAQRESLVGFALDDGAEVWRIDGAADGEIHRIRLLWIDDERAYVVGDRGLAAVDPSSGAIAWAEVAVAEGCGVVSGADVVVIEEATGGHRKIDAATGAELGRIDVPARGRQGTPSGAGEGCRWGQSAYDGGVAMPVIDGGRLLIQGGPADRRGPAALRALDLAGGGEVWRREGLGQEHLLVDQDAVYVDRGGEHLVALDVASGRPQAEISIGGGFEAAIALGGGAAAPLVVVTSDQTGTWFLGRGAAPAIAEDYVIRGRLVVDEGMSPRRAAGVLVRVGDKVVRTDRSGRFTAKGRLLGAVPIAPGDLRDPYALVENGARIFRFDATHVILDDRGTYDVGDVLLYEWIAA